MIMMVGWGGDDDKLRQRRGLPLYETNEMRQPAYQVPRCWLSLAIGHGSHSHGGAPAQIEIEMGHRVALAFGNTAEHYRRLVYVIYGCTPPRLPGTRCPLSYNLQNRGGRSNSRQPHTYTQIRVYTVYNVYTQCRPVPVYSTSRVVPPQLFLFTPTPSLAQAVSSQ